MWSTNWNFDQDGPAEETDETGINLRAYFDRMPDEKMREYSPEWSDARVLEWDGNFTSEGRLLLICSEREVDVGEYRRVLEQSIEYRHRVRG